METLIIIVFIVLVLAYYGFMRSAETAANMANKEIEHLADVHEVGLIERTAKMAEKLDDETIKQAEEVKAKLRAMRGL